MRARFADDKTQLAKIDEFDANYRACNAVQWYTQDTFLYRQLNAAIRKPDIEVSFAFRFYIHDIYHQLKILHERQASCLRELTVYRGQQMTGTELDRLNVGRLISVDSFFSTSKRREIALVFAGPPPVSSDLVGILFVIEVNTLQPSKNKPYADISSLSDFGWGEREVLFMLGTVFRLTKREFDESSRLWTIKLELCAEEDTDLVAAEISMQEEMAKNDNSNSFLFLCSCLKHKVRGLNQQFMEGIQGGTAESLADAHKSVVEQLWKGAEDPMAEMLKEKQVRFGKQMFEGIDLPGEEALKKIVVLGVQFLEEVIEGVEDPVIPSRRAELLNNSKTLPWLCGVVDKMIDSETKDESEEDEESADLSVNNICEGFECLLHDFQPSIKQQMPSESSESSSESSTDDSDS